MTRNLKFLNHIALVVLTLCLSAAIGKAQNAYAGKFTLPFETHWGGAVLPAGDYTMTVSRLQLEVRRRFPLDSE